ncbi:MAG: PAS domain-containing sensor histidine kinase, partial [Gemmatimonadaceae bacterium]|nr:PAS domain-containing sensor histidine kinase [Gemmatimonadaceae bacterium]
LADGVREYAIFLMDPDGIITYWGEGARLIKWWTKDEVEGAHLRVLYPGNGSDDGTAEEHMRQAAERGEYSGEGQRVRAGGSTFWAGVTLTALRDDSGDLLGFAKVTRDLTARRAADSLLQAAATAAEEAREAAVAADIAKSGFLATMSHEIRTPINAIMGYHDLLDLGVGGPLTDEQRMYLSRAQAGGHHLLRIINEVLDFSRLDHRGLEVNCVAVRVGDVVREARALIEPQATQAGISVIDSVAGYAAGLAVSGDEDGIRQILVNLLSNAVKFTPRGGRVIISAGTAERPPADVGVSFTGAEPWVYIRVEDTGPGMAPERVPQVFEPFVQGDMSLTRAHGGTGLGLAISRRLARLMGGEITARSTLGTGSTFFIWLPAAVLETMRTGGVEGHGPGAPGAGEAIARAATQSAVPMMGALRGIADAVLSELERILQRYVNRLRTDPETPTAHAIGEELIEDHLATFVADIGSALQMVDVALGEASPDALDTTAIQRALCERHGAQRARLGFTESELRREFAILGEEVIAGIRRRAPHFVRGPNIEARAGEVERSIDLLAQLFVLAERTSVVSFRRALEAQTESAN